MRSALLLAALVGFAAAHSHGIPQRKTLGFGPDLTHAEFVAQPQQLASLSGLKDPLELASAFIREHTGGAQFQIREDTYTDSNTGVTHVFARQMVDGVEVADADFNLNIKDGVVLSFGNSFHKGDVSFRAASLADPHAELCAALNFNLVKLAALGNDVSAMSQIHRWNCEHVGSPYAIRSQLKEANPSDPMAALIQFMIAATPDEKLSQQLLADPMSALGQMNVVPQLADGQVTVENVPGAINPVKAKIALVQVPVDGQTQLEMVWKFEVEMQDNWYEAAVTVEAPHRIISVVDWASDAPMNVEQVNAAKQAEYTVYKWGINDPEWGDRTVEKESTDKLAAPAGWHALPNNVDPSKPRGSGWRNTTTTWGNNVFAQENWAGRNDYINNKRPDGGADLKFNFEYNPKKDDSPMPVAKKYIDAAVTQMFYTVNLVHDLYYRYGFDEPAGNFQQYNFGRGGKETDAVIGNAQDGSGFNNANFMTPPDGQNGRMRMYLWNTANPYRDGDLEAGIVIHELSHGLSTRLTGGPANSGCLGWGEAGGMGEGWGDFLATVIRSTSKYSDYPMGAWAANKKTGIRNFPYSTDEKVNPSVYKTLDKPGYWGVHAIGEVWAEILWEVVQNLIKTHGFSETLFPPAALADGTVPEGDFYRPAEYTATGERRPLVPKHGNTLAVQIVLNGMKTQPCRPTFFQARDAIIEADKVLTNGENFCDLWNGFAKRGLGPDAVVKGQTPWGGGVRTNDFNTHKNCKK